ncbi:hypothetical protein E2C01_077449 [Portunus trituberculatus]|uniref:Uncharacterized protein n=1 Tax=Portunus trituberculatus TaxID=210409 RepID=A0A5B7IM57_PORTR|nr:hypothetical protein [Portunus trituberculatus]
MLTVVLMMLALHPRQDRYTSRVHNDKSDEVNNIDVILFSQAPPFINYSYCLRKYHSGKR